MSYKLYLAVSFGMGPQDHHSILIETDEVGAIGNAHIYQVKGNIQAGMTYDHRPAREDDINLGQTLLGLVSAFNFERVDQICREIPVPKKQFNGHKRLYPREPLRRCQEWTKEALEALTREGVLEPVADIDPPKEGVPVDKVLQSSRFKQRGGGDYGII
ncbi:Uu.00g008880.m01.CDS01 [Anthostomella pinea]|uniref:Uu.00g008880.m01.CDS01 n=1 Tax=Anthostomella pinea TaxID=933095 RepID=A0AAI8YPU1_9PEZI|nr:Uu.00g008880.m01.CDS01 [Anthostomella pinea]